MIGGVDFPTWEDMCAAQESASCVATHHERLQSDVGVPEQDDGCGIFRVDWRFADAVALERHDSGSRGDFGKRRGEDTGSRNADGDGDAAECFE